MRSYSVEQMVSYGIEAGTFTVLAATVKLPTQTVAARAVETTNQPLQARRLKSSQVLGFSGLVKTAGAGTILLGDGTTADRYGRFVVDGGLAVGDCLTGLLTLSEEGFRMGSDKATAVDKGKQSVTLTMTGALEVERFVATLGYF